MRPDHSVCDQIIQTLAEREVELEAHIQVLERDMESYRELSQVAIGQIADLQQANRRLRNRLRHVEQQLSDRSASALKGVA